MAWALVSETTKVPLRRRNTIGRTHFPNEPKMSRVHFEITVHKGDRLFIKDLNSTNGTSINGEKISPGAEREVFAGDLIRIGTTEFTPAYVKSREYLKLPEPGLRLDIALFLIVYLLVMSDTSLEFGLSIGWIAAGLLICSVIVPFFTGALLGHWLVLSRFNFKRRSESYAALVLFVSLILNHGIMFYGVDSDPDLARDMIQHKIEYFCLNHFKQNECVRQVGLCPACAIHIDKWKRDIIVERLKQYRAKYPPSMTPPAELRQPASH